MGPKHLWIALAVAIAGGLGGSAQTRITEGLPSVLGLVAWYDASTWDAPRGLWRDGSGNGNDARLATSPGASVQLLSTGSATPLPRYLMGNAYATLLFPRFGGTYLPDNYTLLHVARYAGDTRGRILTTDDVDMGSCCDWRSGFDQQRAGVALQDGVWLTQQADLHGRDWVLSTDMRHRYRSQGVERTLPGLVFPAPPSSRNCSFGINAAATMPGTASDWAVAAVLLYSRQLGEQELSSLEEYLLDTYMRALPDALPPVPTAGLMPASCERHNVGRASAHGFWCMHEGSQASHVDCDGDGVLDWACADMYGGRGVILSSANCTDSWPNAPSSACPPLWGDGGDGPSAAAAAAGNRTGSPACAHLDGFYAIFGAGHDGSDIGQAQDGAEDVVEAAAEACRELTDCAAFTSAGDLKRAAMPNVVPMAGFCFYVRILPRQLQLAAGGQDGQEEPASSSQESGSQQQPAAPVSQPLPQALAPSAPPSVGPLQQGQGPGQRSGPPANHTASGVGVGPSLQPSRGQPQQPGYGDPSAPGKGNSSSSAAIASGSGVDIDNSGGGSSGLSGGAVAGIAVGCGIALAALCALAAFWWRARRSPVSAAPQPLPAAAAEAGGPAKDDACDPQPPTPAAGPAPGAGAGGAAQPGGVANFQKGLLDKQAADGALGVHGQGQDGAVAIDIAALDAALVVSATPTSTCGPGTAHLIHELRLVPGPGRAGSAGASANAAAALDSSSCKFLSEPGPAGAGRGAYPAAHAHAAKLPSSGVQQRQEAGGSGPVLMNVRGGCPDPAAGPAASGGMQQPVVPRQSELPGLAARGARLALDAGGGGGGALGTAQSIVAPCPPPVPGKRQRSGMAEEAADASGEQREAADAHAHAAQPPTPLLGSGPMANAGSLNAKAVLAQPAPSWQCEIDARELHVKERLGKGGFAEVHRGMWRGTAVAIKLLEVDEMTDEEVAHCKQEIALMCQLRHPRIVQLLGAAVMADGQLAIVMELSPRGSLFDMLHKRAQAAQRQQLDGRRRLRMAMDVARGIEYLHSRTPPVVHRDIKSANVLVAADWGAKLCDFGLSKPRNATYLSNRGPAGGTPAWMAPEVLLGQPSHEKSDMYSYGVLLYELVTGCTPWPEVQHEFQLVHLVGTCGQRPDLPQGLDPRVTSLIARCWAQDPAQRPHAAEVLEVLHGLAELPCVGRAAGGAAVAAAAGPAATTANSSQDSGSGGASARGAGGHRGSADDGPAGARDIGSEGAPSGGRAQSGAVDAPAGALNSGGGDAAGGCRDGGRAAAASPFACNYDFGSVLRADGTSGGAAECSTTDSAPSSTHAGAPGISLVSGSAADRSTSASAPDRAGTPSSGEPVAGAVDSPASTHAWGRAGVQGVSVASANDGSTAGAPACTPEPSPSRAATPDAASS